MSIPEKTLKPGTLIRCKGSTRACSSCSRLGMVVRWDERMCCYDVLYTECKQASAMDLWAVVD